MGAGRKKLMDPLWLLLIGIFVVVGSILLLRLHAFLALLLGALIVGGLTSPGSLETFARGKKYNPQQTKEFVSQTLGKRVANEFGQTCGKIGILIALASIIGKCLLDSGAADRIVRSALKIFGEKKAPLGFLSSSFLLATPVYFDTVFYLMVPLGKAMGLRTGKNYVLYVLAIVAAGTMAHSLVPPTPGPLFVAGELSVDLGMMIIGGFVVGIFTSSAGYLYAVWANKKWPIPIRETADTSLEELEELAKRDQKELPALWLSILPIILPVFLIAGDTILSNTFGKNPSNLISGDVGHLIKIFKIFGDPNIALTISAAISLITLVNQKKSTLKSVSKAVQHALASGGIIILITAAGGAFGAILQQTGIGFRIQELAFNYQVAVLPLAFFVAALVRTAQGSATVAMITAVGILSGFADPATLGFHPVYLALAIGCGSKPFPWMNDSGFWIICKMSGFTETETLKLSSVMMTLMGIVGLLVVLVLSKLFPLI
jgi:GntP family gluconate:H+ symporter